MWEGEGSGAAGFGDELFDYGGTGCGKNGSRTPDKIVSGSARQVWWKCPKGRDHEWRSSVAGRTAGKRLGCPFCTNRRLSETNSLARVSLRKSKEWRPTKNGKLRPRDVVAGSTRLVWWRCKRVPDHVWRQSPAAHLRVGDVLSPELAEAVGKQ
ncbi:MAG: zinc-ribbon domain-containing protein [Polyangiaceae bacterium]